MKLFIIGSRAYDELVERIEKIEQAIIGVKPLPRPSDDEWVDGTTVCRYLRISPRTLQRLRSDRVITYSALNHKLYYTLGEIKRVLQERSKDRCKK